MPGWKLIDSHPTQGRTFRRSLSTYEHGFFLDGFFFKGTTDAVHHFELRLLSGAKDADVLSEENIVRAWVSTKKMYPLMGAIVQGHGLEATSGSKADGEDGDDGDKRIPTELYFVVREHDLSRLRPCEVVFGQVANKLEAEERAAAILDGPRLLSAELLVQLYVFREVASDKARAGFLHLMLSVAHCVSDWTANWMMLRYFLDTLGRTGETAPEKMQASTRSLEDRLAMVIPLAELEPIHLRTLSLARRRWRRAVGTVIVQLRTEKMKGGHTLPCRFTHSTSHTAARSSVVFTSLTHEQTVAVIENCRQHKVTFGSAYTVLAQVAMTRVLYRRYLRGEMSEEEWTYRKRQPYINGSPVDLRSYLDKAWFEQGGGGEYMLSYAFFFIQLPFMTLGGTDDKHPRDCECNRKRTLLNGAPPFPDLLTFDRFLHRIEMTQKQTTAILNHPLFLEIMHAGNLKFSENQRLEALQQMSLTKVGPRDRGSETDEVLAVKDAPLWTVIGSSLGNMDRIFPSEYPLPSTHELSSYCSVSHPTKAGHAIIGASSWPPISYTDIAPKIAVEYIGSHLHTRPGELYLSGVTTHGLLNMCVYYDGNVFEERVVRERLAEVREAVLWYLGRTRNSCDEDEQVGLGKGMQARL